MKLKNVFTSGKMNKDSDERLIQKGEYRHALNVRVANSNGSDVGAVENALSNEKMSSINFGSNAKTIGTVEDDAANKIYWCVVSDNGSFVCEFSKESNHAAIILSDNRYGDANILGFTPGNMVDMSILNDAENNKNFLFLTDGVTEPKYFDVDTAKALANNTFTFEDVSLIKPAPYTAPLIELQKTDSKEENYLETKFFSFAYRYIYDNNEISAVSPFSEFAFMPNEFKYDYNSGTNKSMENEYNKAVVSFNTGSKNVKKIEILAKQSGDNVTYIVEKLDKEDKGWVDNSTQNYTFTNSKVYKALPESQLRRVYDNVPRKAKTLDIIGNRVVFGNYTENYNMSNNGVSIIPKLDLSYTSVSGSRGIPHKTIKTNMDYEVGISYTDGKGRMTTPFTSEGSSIHIPITNSDKKNTLNVEISSKAPDWAEGYRFFIKQSKNDYDVISPVVFYREGVYAYIKVEGEDINKVKEGDFLFVKSDTSGIRNKPIKIKVLESEKKERNFLSGSSEANTIQESGNYIKVDTEEIALDETSIDTFLYEGYAFRSDGSGNDLLNNVAYIDAPVFYGQGSDDLSASGTYSSSTDTRYEIKIFSEGTPDRIKWRSLDCKSNLTTAWNDNSGAGIPISGSIPLSNGVSVSFSSTTGHTIDDRWIVSAKSSARPNEWDKGGDVGDDGRRAIMLFKCKSSSDESIKSGAIITLEYDDTKSDVNVDNTVGYTYNRFVASADYANLEEWFWEDNVISQMDYPEDIADIMFRRGSLADPSGEQMTINPGGDLFMAMLSPCNYSGSARIRIDIDFKIIELDNSIILETDYKFASSDVFYELPKTYGISNGNHLGDVNQVFGSTNAVVNLDHFNAFGWYNGYESIKIYDGFNQSRMLVDSKPLVPLDDYKEITRIASLTYSDVYEVTTSYNGINEFNLSKANYKDLDPSFGKIAKIISRNGDLTVIQNNRVSRVLYNKSVIYNADGSGNVSQNNNVLGQEVPYQGEFGITNNIYSATKWNGDIYFADERRGSVIRLTDNGIFPISTYGMISWFNDHLYVGSNVVSSFDPNNDQFVLSISNPNIEWIEDTYECAQLATTTTTEAPVIDDTICFVDVEIPENPCLVEWRSHTYFCNTLEWLEDTYECSELEWLEDTYECEEGATTTVAPTTIPPVYGTGTCNIRQNGASSGAGYWEYTIQLGGNVGEVLLNYNAYMIPDKFVVEYDGEVVIDTGFVGDPTYDSQLLNLGYTAVTGVGGGTASFIKSTSTPETALVKVTAPLQSTAWEFTMTCPTDSPNPTTVAPTTVAPTTLSPGSYIYYSATACDPNLKGTVFFRSTTPISPGEVVKINAYGERCFIVGQPDGNVTLNDAFAFYPDCDACNPTTTVAPTTAAPTTAAPTTASPTTAAPTTAAPTTAAPTTAAPTTVPPTAAPTTAATVYPGSITTANSLSDDACASFAFDGVWFATPTPEDGSRVYTNSSATTAFNGGDQWFGIDMDGNGVYWVTQITSFGYMYNTVICTGGGGF